MTEPTLPELLEVVRLRVALDNPRHEPVPSEPDAIAYLLKKERVLELATDIAVNGANPMENIGVVKSENGKDYRVIEGNRRACSLVLLNDPMKAPSKYRPKFQQLASKYTVQTKVLAHVFPDAGEVDPWLDRMHKGQNEGIGRRSWSTLQQARRDPTNNNRRAYLMVSYAVSQGLANFDDFEDQLTSVERFTSNPRFREKVGIVYSEEEELGFSFSRPTAEFDRIVSSFLDDIAAPKPGKPYSRYSSDEVIDYADSLFANLGIDQPTNGGEGSQAGGEGADANTYSSGGTESASATDNNGGSDEQNAETASPFVRKVNKLVHDKRIADALQRLNNAKLSRLYKSFSVIPYSKHSVLLSVGVWSFLESLTSLAGRKPNNAFKDFLNSQWKSLGLPTDQSKSAMREALERFAANGNTSKHHPTAGSFNGEQMNADLEVISDVIIALIKRSEAQIATLSGRGDENG